MPNSIDERLALPVEQGALLWCMRAWVAGMRHDVGATEGIQHMLDRLGAPDAAPYLEGLMFAIGHGATRAVGVHCVCCKGVSDDERALLDAIALAQQHRTFEALLLLRGMMGAEGARAALQSIEGIGKALARAGRQLSAPELEMRQSAFKTRFAGAGRAAGRTLH